MSKKVSDVWEQLMTECPHCGDIFEIENSDIGKDKTCINCEEEFEVGE